MARISPGAVEGILVDNYDGVTDLAPFILAATNQVDYIVTQDTARIMTPQMLQIVETWLAAHFYFHADRAYKSKSTGSASGSFDGATAMVFNSTLYGQTAMANDFTNTLARRNQEVSTGYVRTAGLLWLGKCGGAR